MPLIPSPINRVPRGLLDFLGIRAAGRNPQTLSEQLIPTLDLNDWYKAADQLNVLFTLTALAADTNAGLLLIPATAPNITTLGTVKVPKDQIWIFRRGCNVRWTFSSGVATGYCSLATANVTSGFTQPWPMHLSGFTSALTATIASGTNVLEQEMWLTPDDEVNVMLHGFQNGGAETMGIAGSLSVVRLRL